MMEFFNSGLSAYADTNTLWTIFWMAVITVISRSFFFISETPWALPAWAQRGL